MRWLHKLLCWLSYHKYECAKKLMKGVTYKRSCKYCNKKQIYSHLQNKWKDL